MRHTPEAADATYAIEVTNHHGYVPRTLVLHHTHFGYAPTTFQPGAFQRAFSLSLSMPFWLFCCGVTLTSALCHAEESGSQGSPQFIEREFILDGRYLNIPVKTGMPRRTMSISVDGNIVRRFEIELAEGDVDLWAFTDVSPWRGKKAVVRLEPDALLILGGNLPEFLKRTPDHPMPPNALESLQVSDEIKNSNELYSEALRPQFHFTARRGHIGDPNGLVYFKGEYHLFFQLQPFGVRHVRDKSWGHAVSRDLVHWEELPIALYPDNLGQIYSGSGMVDWNNVSGFQKGNEPPLLLFYTATGISAMRVKRAEADDFVQCMAYSNDRGRTWTKFEGNPFLKNISPGNRDPLVFWHEPSKRWIMVLYVGHPTSFPGSRPAAQIFSSVNLKEWNFESSIEGFNDCPNFFELPLDENRADTRWIIHSADMRYKVGRFDGKTFTPETPLLIGQKGESAYAAQTFNDMPDARRVQVAWGRNEAPGMPFSQIMTFPCELSLATTAEGPRMRWRPVREIEKLHGKRKFWLNEPLPAYGKPVVLARGKHLDIYAAISVGNASEVEVNVRGIPIICHVKDKLLTVNGYASSVALKEGYAGIGLREGKLQLRILLDRISMEVFADDGLVYMPLAVVPPADNDMITIAARGGSARADAVEIFQLKSMWSAQK